MSVGNLSAACRWHAGNVTRPLPADTRAAAHPPARAHNSGVSQPFKIPTLYWPSGRLQADPCWKTGTRPTFWHELRLLKYPGEIYEGPGLIPAMPLLYGPDQKPEGNCTKSYSCKMTR